MSEKNSIQYWEFLDVVYFVMADPETTFSPVEADKLLSDIEKDIQELE